MKNIYQNEVKQISAQKSRKAVLIDVVVLPEITSQNYERLASQPRHKRRKNYIKKIMNDAFIFSV